ncbi:hypothetical protein PAXRUDRAFT_831354 [Paxillus rubicundulus Ve08.2h10]|uniref:Uncharacterized protein n=1 Tax=Paxillus rubicundulus Ve08.2h10 TaxID=930991 RepID=A0A0D0DIH7_9AGAM|nr:hypothetical protein PAXRUDRAFT_831354 [Paxillus rubicundulus Ve08.2h10]
MSTPCISSQLCCDLSRRTTRHPFLENTSPQVSSWPSAHVGRPQGVERYAGLRGRSKSVVEDRAR